MRSILVVICLVLEAGLSFAQVGFSKVAYGSGSFNGSVAVADFNGDGFPDFAAIDGPNGTLTIFRNLKNGSFENAGQYSVNTLGNPSWIDTADFDGDGKMDLVVRSAFSPQMQLWHGNGDGTFSAWNVVPNVTSDPITLRLADVNGDGAVDLVTLECTDGRDTTCPVQIYLNDQHGNFSPTQGPVVTKVSDMIVGDFDLDGKQDILINLYAPTNALEFYTGNGSGAFTLTSSSNLTFSGQLTTGSFNKTDTALDVAVVTTGRNAAVYLNDGHGHFGLRSRPSTGTNLWAIAAGSINGDSYQDLLTANADLAGQGGTLQYLLGQGDGYFSTPVKIASSLVAPETPVIRDLTLDGRHDIVLPAGAVYVLRNTNAAVTCAPPQVGALTAKFCSTTQSTRATQTVKASGNSAAGIVRLELWIDGKKNYEIWNDQLSRAITLSAGTHEIVAVAVDRFGKVAKATQNVTVR